MSVVIQKAISQGMGQLQLIKQKLENSLNRDKRTFPSRDQVQRAALAEEVLKYPK